MEKTIYELPTLDIIDIAANDVITTSGPLSKKGICDWDEDENGETFGGLL